MIKERRFSAKYDFHTGIISKFCFFFSVILLLIAGVELLLSITILLTPGSYFALAILFVGLGFISWFFHSQFAKLSEVASEIEDEHYKK